MRPHLFLCMFLCILSRTIASPNQVHPVKRGLEVTNADITQFDDIRNKKHEYIMFNPETHQQEKNEGSTTPEDIDVFEKWYKLMEDDKVPFISGIHAPWIHRNNDGQWIPDTGAGIVFWTPITQEELQRRLDKGRDGVEKTASDVIKKVQNRAKELADCGWKFTRVIGIDVEVVLQDKLFSDDEYKFFPTLPAKVRMTKDPDAFSLIDDGTILVAINTGARVMNALDLENLPGMIITDMLTYVNSKDQPPTDGKFFEIFKQYQNEVLMAADTPGIHGPAAVRLYW